MHPARHIISEPVPVEIIIGISAIIVVIVVIMAGRTRTMAPSITVFRIAALLENVFSLNDVSRVERSTTALSVATPNRAINPTHTAVENLNPSRNNNMTPPIRDTGRPVDNILF